MENTSNYTLIEKLNDSAISTSTNASTLGEFPYWRIVLSYLLITELFIYSPIALFINSSLFFAILKSKSLCRPLNLIHLSLLSLNCLIVIPHAMTTCVYIPPMIRFCSCSRPVGSLYLVIELLYAAFQPLNYACLGVFQLLIIQGKKRLVSYISVTASIVICFVTSVLLVSEGLALVNIAGQTYACQGLCPQTISQQFSGLAFTFTSYALVCLLPSFIIVTVCTTWSCVIFKKAYIGDSDELNRRIISLPIVLPVVLVLPYILSNTLLFFVERIVLSTVPFSVYWSLFNRLLIFQSYEFISGIAYPFILMLLNPKIGRPWKELVFKKKCWKQSNRVFPITSNTTPSTSPSSDD